MKKKTVQVFISIFWGVNFLLLMVYAIVQEIIDLIRKKKEPLYEDPDYNRQFRILIIIPILSLISIVGVVFTTAYTILNVFQIILTIYGFLLVICLGFILFGQNTMKAFDKEATGIITSYKQFAFFVILDIFVFMARAFLIGIFYLSSFIYFSSIFTVIALSIYLVRIYFVFKNEKPAIDELGESQELTQFNSSSYPKLLKNIIQIQEATLQSIKNQEFSQGQIFIENLELKSRDLLKIAKKSKIRNKISEANITQRKIEKLRYELEKRRDIEQYKTLYDTLKKQKNQENTKEYEQNRKKLISLIQTRMDAAKKIHNRKDVTKFSEILKNVNDNFPQ